MGRHLATLLIVLSAPAQAQPLSYSDVLREAEETAPRLSYAETAEATGADEGPVRAFYGDRVEWRGHDGANAYHWDFSGEIGGARHRLWLAVTGDGTLGGPLDYVEAHALYGHVLGSGWMVQAGVRRDFVRPRRTYAELAVQGSPLESSFLGLSAYLSNEGELTGRVTAYYDWELVPDLILQPFGEVEVAAQDAPELGVGAGPVYLETALRLRYRLDERFSPYIGINRLQLLGRTGRLAREAGDEAVTTSLLVGVRSYFE